TFWRQRLDGFAAPTPLGLDWAQLGFFDQSRETYEEFRCQLSSDITACLQALGRQHHLTMNTLVQGGWALLLSNYSGETDVVFGATVSGRPPQLTGSEAMVGIFVNTLPLRVRIAPEAIVLDWLKQLQDQQIKAR